MGVVLKWVWLAKFPQTKPPLEKSCLHAPGIPSRRWLEVHVENPAREYRLSRSAASTGKNCSATMITVTQIYTVAMGRFLSRLRGLLN